MQSPIEVIGSGFIVGVPGIYGNTVIPAAQPEPAPYGTEASSISPDVPAETPHILDTSVSRAQPAKAKPAKATNQE